MSAAFPRTRAGSRSSARPRSARATGNTGQVVQRIREAVAAVDPTMTMFDVHTLAEEMGAALVEQRLVALLSTIFGGLALLLACVECSFRIGFCRRLEPIDCCFALTWSLLSCCSAAARWAFASSSRGRILDD